jgi:transcriptional regulator with XRE-family HTH domain
VLNYAIEELGHTQAELAELLDSRSRASEILSRRRALTVDTIHKISKTWKIPADLLVRPYKIERAAWRVIFKWVDSEAAAFSLAISAECLEIVQAQSRLVRS